MDESIEQSVNIFIYSDRKCGIYTKYSMSFYNMKLTYKRVPARVQESLNFISGERGSKTVFCV